MTLSHPVRLTRFSADSDASQRGQATFSASEQRSSAVRWHTNATPFAPKPKVSCTHGVTPPCEWAASLPEHVSLRLGLQCQLAKSVRPVLVARFHFQTRFHQTNLLPNYSLLEVRMALQKFPIFSFIILPSGAYQCLKHFPFFSFLCFISIGDKSIHSSVVIQRGEAYTCFTHNSHLVISVEKLLTLLHNQSLLCDVLVFYMLVIVDRVSWTLFYVLSQQTVYRRFIGLGIYNTHSAGSLDTPLIVSHRM